MPSIFKRNLIRLGEQNLAITLPLAWTSYYGLKPGDKVEMIVNGEVTIRLLPKEEATETGDPSGPPQE